MRNWWAHVSVSIDDCVGALQAIVDFVIIVLQPLNLPSGSVLDELSSLIESISISKLDDLRLTSDQVAYLYLVRAFRRLSNFSDGITRTCKDSEFSKLLLVRMQKKQAFGTRRQRDVVEPVDVARSVLDLISMQCFAEEHQQSQLQHEEERHQPHSCVKVDCMVIISARNCFAHEAEQSNRVLAAACAIGAVSRLLDFMSEHCILSNASAIRSDLSAVILEISQYQELLLARMDALNLPLLLQHLVSGYKSELADCQYSSLLSTDYEKAALLLMRRIPRHLATCIALPHHALDLSVNLTVAKRQRSLLRIVMILPPSVPDLETAVDWLFSSPFPNLLGCSGVRVLCHGFKKKMKIPTWIESLPEQTQHFILHLIDATKKHSQSHQRFLRAESLFQMAFQKSQEARKRAHFFDPNSRPSQNCDLQQLNQLSEVFVGYDDILICLSNLREAVETRDSTEAAIKSLHSDSVSLEHAKRHLRELFHSLFIGKDGKAMSWDEVKQMCRTLDSHSSHIELHSLFDPAPFFEFYNIFAKKGCCTIWKSMFDSSVEILEPIFQNLCAPYNFEALEASLGSNYLHGMTMLAALASRSLQKYVEAHSTNLSSSVPIKIAFNRQTTGMSAIVAADDKFIGREDEMACINKRVWPLFELQDSQHKSFVLIRGQSGTGKSCLAMRQLCLVQNKFCSADLSPVFAYFFQGCGSGVVRDALYRMGLALRFRLGFDRFAHPNTVLPSLKAFLSQHRFLLVVDDADESGLRELVNLLPKSKSCAACCVVITSKVDGIEEIVSELSLKFRFQFDSNPNGDDIHLSCFSPGIALQLTEFICQDAAKIGYMQIKNELPRILAGDESSSLGLLPLGVRLFAEWLRFELLQNRSHSVLERWKFEYDRVIMPDNPLPGHRGLCATVRLALHNLRYNANHEACMHLLGMLALCDTTQVPWSIFDGGTNREAQLLMRGARVEVTGDSLNSISSLGQRCRVMRLKSGKIATKHRFARIISDHIQDGKIQVAYEDEKIVNIPINDLEFGPHIAGYAQDERGVCTLKLQTPFAARNIDVTINNHDDVRLNGQHAVTNSHFLSWHVDTETTADCTIGVTLLETGERVEMKIKHLQLPDGVSRIHDGLFFTPKPAIVTSRFGRVLQHHAHNNTVTVIFGCETGECFQFMITASLFLTVCRTTERDEAWNRVDAVQSKRFTHAAS